ncbi:molybdopterin guanine dinucleotide biosynthesis accessory protein MobB [Stella humosa]|uniref:Molybdopterin guanine dinucleotide biosynthesis accessory protein MobB n=1 Tax=Stella humosa TaxID=94 RepID=A0A3N1L0V6_9PROT|nr:molybdopterin-guanine dinucleotide biosynthesis protein B [Stella humosa]ROP84076.1 molybdopterin guanine dinucleotide biosynthesis accessory protein MobB [Stella humosa]BBK33588.1 molybdopterin-guanine dinucleotide biosynthesis protein MobB [Stella humosa]
MKVFGLAGWSGSGKTTLLARLIPELRGRGLSVSTVKHAHHAFDLDQPGKDSHTHRQAGATEVLISSGLRWALMHELRGAEEPPLAELLGRMSPVDLVLVEGFKRAALPKLEIHRPALGKPLLAVDDPMIVAIASDSAHLPVDHLPVGRPLLPLGDTARIADFILAHLDALSHQPPAPAPALAG